LVLKPRSIIIPSKAFQNYLLLYNNKKEAEGLFHFLSWKKKDTYKNFQNVYAAGAARPSVQPMMKIKQKQWEQGAGSCSSGGFPQASLSHQQS
jgi:hypothetical protein